MLRNYCYDKYLSDRGWDRAGDDTNMDQVVRDINSASVRAYETDPTMTKDKYMFIKNGLIPYDPQTQFPNAYKEWQNEFNNADAYASVVNTLTYNRMHNVDPNDKKNFNYCLGRPDGPNGELYVISYSKAKDVYDNSSSEKQLSNALGFNEGTYADGAHLVKMDKSLVTVIPTYSRPSDAGANYYWAPGLRTSGGQYECLINRITDITDKENDNTMSYDHKYF